MENESKKKHVVIQTFSPKTSSVPREQKKTLIPCRQKFEDPDSRKLWNKFIISKENKRDFRKVKDGYNVKIPYTDFAKYKSEMVRITTESQTNKRKDLMALFTLIGFSVMMILDVALG